MLPITHWPVRIQRIGEDIPSNMLSFINLNHWSFTEHTSWPSKPQLPKFLRWDSWAWIMSQKWDDVSWVWTMGFDAFLCKYGLFWALKEVFPKFMIMLTWCGLPMKWNYVVWKICPKHISNKRVTHPKKASSTYSTKPNQKTISLYKKRECPFGLFN